MDRGTCAAPTRLPPSGRKAKPKAPLPPPETKITDSSSFDDSELKNFTMEQKENIIDREIELSVVLPGDVIKCTTVNGSKPMMDLLVYLCAQYRLNPSSHTIDLMSVEQKQIKFKPNTPIGMLEVDKVILKPKQIDKRKPTPVIPEQTVRVVVNYKKTQKTIVRVSPHVPLQELMQIICNKCDFDLLHTVLLKTYQSQETLDLTKSLNDLGLRELYAMDVSKATPTTEFNFSSLQDSCQNSQNSEILKEKESKGFFSFFQRSKKKREQTASAPATPLMSKPRPAFGMKSNTISKQYDSNTLPSDMPKKRRAPLPPMPASQSVPQDLAQAQDRPAASVMKSSSVDETDKGLSGIGIVRTGSLQLSGTSSVNSSLRRAKRKAPSPPPRKLQSQSDNSIETESESAESIHIEERVKGRYSEVFSPTGNVVDLTRTAAVPSGASGCSEPSNHDQNNIPQVSEESSLLVNADTPDESEVSFKSDIGSEYSLEEIDEKEEILHEESADPFAATQQASTSADPDVPLDAKKNEPPPLASSPGMGTEENVRDSSGLKQENMSAEDKDQHNQVCVEKVAFDSGKPLGAQHLNTNSGHSDAKFPPTVTEEGKISVVGATDRSNLEALNYQGHEDNASLNQRHSPQPLLGAHNQKWDQSDLETTKTQDVAIQTGPPECYLGQTASSEETDPQGYKLITHRASTHLQKSVVENQPSGFPNKVHETTGSLTELSHKGQQAVHDRASPNGNQSNTFANDEQDVPQRLVKSPLSSPTKGYPLYRQDSKPKPKPSNEITRDYIPKVGMTTYKIVPPKSLEIVKNWESDHTENPDAASLHMPPKNEHSQEFGTQTEIHGHWKSSNQTGPSLRSEVTLPGNDPLAKTYGVVDKSTMSFSNAEGKRMEAEHSKPNPDPLRAPSELSTEHKSFSPPAVQEKSSVLSPPPKPSSFYLQMQRRASGHYVTSAIARSNSVSSSTPSEAKSIETEKKLASPEQTSFPFPRTVDGPSQVVKESTENGHSAEKTEITTSPVKRPMSLSSPTSQPPPLNLKTLRTFVLPQPYSSTRPSPFALAVSSAVKRSQSFSKTYTSTTRPLKEQASLNISSSVSTTEIKGLSPLPSPATEAQPSVPDKKNNCALYEQKRQVPSLSGHPTTAACGRGTALTLQRPDPEQIHQSLLAAIRSGEAAAKLRRVAPPSNTVAINGRSSLSSQASIEPRYSNH
ncbi:cordon-bleu protein-like 1 isoform X8 [Pogona vitticeps]